MMSLRIQQTSGQIAIRSYPAQMSIEQPSPLAVIEQRPADLLIQSKPAQLSIDQTQCFAESGLKPVLQLAREYYQESQMLGIKYIGEMAEEGNALMEIERGGNAIATISMNKGLTEHEFNVVTMPRSRPVIEWERGQVNIQWRQNPAKIDWQVHNKARINIVQYHRVDISMERYPSIYIEVVGKNVDQSV